MADGKVSLDDCDALTWSLGCTGAPSRSVASEASTSLVFMLVEVPGAGLEDVDRELRVPFAAARPRRPARAMALATSVGNHAEFGVDRRRRPLDRGQRVHQARARPAARSPGSSRPPAGSAPATWRRWARAPRPSSRARSGIRCYQSHSTAGQPAKVIRAGRAAARTGRREYAFSLVSWCWLCTRRMVPLLRAHDQRFRGGAAAGVAHAVRPARRR